jgi:hypothetical protein
VRRLAAGWETRSERIIRALRIKDILACSGDRR